MDLGEVSAWALGAGVVGLLVLHEINARMQRADQEAPVPAHETHPDADVIRAAALAPDAAPDPKAARAALRSTKLGDRPALQRVRESRGSAAAAVLDAVDQLNATTTRYAKTVVEAELAAAPPVWVRAIDGDLVHAIDAPVDQLGELVADGELRPPAGGALLFRCGDITEQLVSAREIGYSRCTACTGALQGEPPGGAG